jgi:hypothetical protein
MFHQGVVSGVPDVWSAGHFAGSPHHFHDDPAGTCGEGVVNGAAEALAPRSPSPWGGHASSHRRR